MKIERRKLSEIKSYAGNPRVNDHAVEAVADSIREFGFRQPIVLDAGGVIIAGHTRYKAAGLLGLEEVPVHVARDLSPEQIRAYRLADNKLAELALWDPDLLADELAELKALQFDLDLLGFSEVELAELLGGATADGLTDPDFIPEPPEAPKTESGDLWLLGDHRLLCGDAGNADDVDRLVEGTSVELVHTDPPYNVGVEPRSSTAIAAGNSSFPDASARMHHQRFDVARGVTDPAKARRRLRPKDRPLAGDFVSDQEYQQLLRAWLSQIARVLEPSRTFYLWGGYSNIANYPAALEASGLYFSQCIIWVKGHPVLTRKDYMGDHEWCFYGWNSGAAHRFFGPPNATDVWAVKKVSPQQVVHLTEKPVELAVRALQNSSRKGEHVLDLFGGSGSTLIACEQTGRRARSEAKSRTESKPRRRKSSKRRTQRTGVG